MSEESERIARFKKLGGVDLADLDPVEQRSLRSEVMIGLANYKKTIFSYVCPLCGRIERSDQEMSPACTGPSWTDEHPLEPMLPMDEQIAPIAMPGLPS